MLQRYKNKEYILNKLHRGFVNVCMAVTLVGSAMLGYKVYEYFRYLRPLRKQMQAKTLEEMLLEGKPIEDVEIQTN